MKLSNFISITLTPETSPTFPSAENSSNLIIIYTSMR